MVILRLRWKLFLVLLCALAAGVLWERENLEERKLHTLPYGFEPFNIYAPPPACGRWKEHMPATRGPKAYRVYIEARKLWRSKFGWQLSREENTRILTDVRTASDLGDWGARALLAHFYLYGLGVLDTNHVLDAAPEKAIEIERMAAKELQPWAIYDLGVAYENGYGGMPHDTDLAWAYFFKAAKLGSPEAQMALASAYAHERLFDNEKTMLQCAYQQMHGAAAYKLALKEEVKKNFGNAINFYQDGVKFGSQDCASALELLFDDEPNSKTDDDEKDILKSLSMVADPERSRRYNAINDALQINPDLKLTRLDEVLPLPPAKLPSWNGVASAVEPEASGPPTYYR